MTALSSGILDRLIRGARLALLLLVALPGARVGHTGRLRRFGMGSLLGVGVGVEVETIEAVVALDVQRDSPSRRLLLSLRGLVRVLRAAASANGLPSIRHLQALRHRHPLLGDGFLGRLRPPDSIRGGGVRPLGERVEIGRGTGLAVERLCFRANSSLNNVVVMASAGVAKSSQEVHSVEFRRDLDVADTWPLERDHFTSCA